MADCQHRNWSYQSKIESGEWMDHFADGDRDRGVSWE